MAAEKMLLTGRDQHAALRVAGTGDQSNCLAGLECISQQGRHGVRRLVWWLACRLVCWAVHLKGKSTGGEEMRAFADGDRSIDATEARKIRGGELGERW